MPHAALNVRHILEHVSHLSVCPTMPRATGNSPMARIMRDIYWPAIEQQSTPHVLGLTASIINGKLLGVRSARNSRRCFRRPCSRPILRANPGGIEQEVVYVKADYPQESTGQRAPGKYQGRAAMATLDGIARASTRRRRSKAARLNRDGMSGSSTTSVNHRSLVERRARTSLMGNSAGTPRVRRRQRNQPKPQLRRCMQGAAKPQADGELTAVPLVAAKATRCRSFSPASRGTPRRCGEGHHLVRQSASPACSQPLMYCGQSALSSAGGFERLATLRIPFLHTPSAPLRR